MKLNDYLILPLTKLDSRGSLSALEIGKHIPFPIERVYYLSELNDQPRGFHAHKETRQFAKLITGSCDFHFDNAFEKLNFSLSHQDAGVLIEPMIWHSMSNFSSNCTLLVLASSTYDEKDYIRDYDEFSTSAGQNI